MKRILTTALSLALLVSPGSALAQPTFHYASLNDFLGLKPVKLAHAPIPKPTVPPKPAPVVYTVVEGDNLSTIGTAYHVEWQRLWAKNVQLTNPDLIDIGAQITIPTADEQLGRDIPAQVSLAPVTPGVAPSQGFGSAGVGGELVGSIGYANPFGNCVNEPGVNNPGYGNPIDWPVLTTTPYIGATFLFWTNHTGVVTGIWSNGDIEVRHQNFQGGQHRFPASMFRGYR